MTSKQLNDRIRELEDIDPRPYESVLGDKLVPYIGWVWRAVDFDDDYYFFGVVPAGVEDNLTNLVGFMENNKWNYRSIRVDGEIWVSIKLALAKALTTVEPADFKAVDDIIQSLASSHKYTAITTTEWI